MITWKTLLVKLVRVHYSEQPSDYCYFCFILPLILVNKDYQILTDFQNSFTDTLSSKRCYYIITSHLTNIYVTRTLFGVLNDEFVAGLPGLI